MSIGYLAMMVVGSLVKPWIIYGQFLNLIKLIGLVLSYIISFLWVPLLWMTFLEGSLLMNYLWYDLKFLVIRSVEKVFLYWNHAYSSAYYGELYYLKNRPRWYLPYERIIEDTFFLMSKNRVMRRKKAFHIFFHDENYFLAFLQSTKYKRDFLKFESLIEPFYSFFFDFKLKHKHFDYSIHYNDVFAWIFGLFEDRGARFDRVFPARVAVYDLTDLYRFIYILGLVCQTCLGMLKAGFYLLIEIPFVFYFGLVEMKIKDICSTSYENIRHQDILILNFGVHSWILFIGIIIFTSIFGVHFLVVYGSSLSRYFVQLPFFRISIFSRIICI